MEANENTFEAMVDFIQKGYKFHMEYSPRGLVKHLLHNLIALQEMGATKEQMQEFYDSHLKSTGYGVLEIRDTSIDENLINVDNWKQFLGQRKHFGEYLHFFEQEVEKLGMEEATRTYFIPILEGAVPGSATHTMIHLAFALQISHPPSVAEALAYCCFRYQPIVHLPPVSVDPNPADPASGTLERMKQIFQSFHEKKDVNLPPPTDIRIMLGHLADQYGDVIAQLTSLWEPNNVEGEPGKASLVEGLEERVFNAAKQLNEAAVWLMEGTGSVDFFFLHLVTSSFSLLSILKCFRHDLAVQFQVLKYHFATLLGIFAAQGRPRITFVTAAERESDCQGQTWEDVLQRAVHNHDEHLSKMVYILWKGTQLFGDADGIRFHIACEAQKKVTHPLAYCFKGVGWLQREAEVALAG